jgi:hypothetical protein
MTVVIQTHGVPSPAASSKKPMQVADFSTLSENNFAMFSKEVVLPVRRLH